MAKKLTVISARNAQPGRHADGDGLYLMVKPTGSRSWLLRVQFKGRRRDIGLGSFTDLTLAEAREEAAKLRRVARRGQDAIIERDKEKFTVPTFKDAMIAAHEELAKGWVPKYAAAFLSSLEAHAVPRLGRQRVDLIDHAMVRDALAPIWTQTPVMARKVRVRINQVLGYAKSRKWRTDAVPDAKEVRTGLAKHSKGGKFAAMPHKDVPAFLAAMTAAGVSMGRLALLFTILTAARNGEVRAATWEQIDAADALWHRPAGAMKGREAHTVTLSPAALAVIEQVRSMTGGVGLIFPGAGGRPLSDMTLTKAMRTAGVGEYTVHGFRSSFRDWTAEMMPTVPAMVAEMALAHSVGNETERAYLRTDLREQRRALMAAWADYCTGQSEGRVVRLAVSNG